MKKIFLTISLIALLLNSKAINVSGVISTNTTWTSSNNPYIVTSTITVNPGITLTIQSGVTVQFNDNFGMTVRGTLTANSAVFTSSSSSPTPGKWSNITIGNTTDSGIVSLTSCQLSYGQSVIIYKGYLTTNGTDFSSFSSYGIFIDGVTTNRALANLTGGTFTNCNNCIYVNKFGLVNTNGTNFSNSTNGFYFASNSMGNSSITGGTISGMTTSAINDNNPTSKSFTNTTINGNCVRGLYLNNANISMTACTVTSCGTPIEYLSSSALVLNGTSNNFSGNTNKYVLINHSSLFNSMTLPTINIPYYFPNGYIIYTGGRLQISDECILKFNYSGINVNQGKLIASASVGKRIYFTSFKDDNLGGDANGDGNATAPAQNNWSGIDFPDASIDSASVLRRVTIKFADRGVEIANASPTLDSCNLSNNYHGVYVTDASYPVINACTFGSSGLTPIAQTFDADPIFTGNIFSFQDNQYDAIGLIGSSIVANAILKIRSVTSTTNITYVMLGDITIPSGKSLTINKGIVIKSYNNYKITVLGALYANGTIDSNIVMTSVKDDNAGGPGDTNKDGTQTSPTKGDFGGIVFTPGSSNNSILNYCDIRFAVLNQTYYANQYQNGGAVTTINANPTISNCKINNCNIGIMCYQASNPTISNNQITNSTSVPFALSVSANPTFSSNTFTNAGLLALGIIGETVTANGLIKKRNISGYTNITYVLLNSLTIANGTNVEIEDGVVIKMDNATAINVDGGLRINGTPTNKVILTSIKDDNEGNPFDTNGDGNATSPSAGNWYNISYNATSNDAYSFIRSATFKYGGYYSNRGVVAWINAAAAMDNCNITNTNGMALYLDGNSNPIIDSVQIQNSTSDPIAMSLLSDPTFTNITFAANATKGIKILDNNLSSNALLKKRSLAGISNIAYYIENLTIGNTATLTIEAGVVVKSIYSYYNYRVITVNGAMVALGTSNERIIFTSTKDDSNGGDYNNDGNATTPGKNNWTAIEFNASSLTSNLKNCIFRYGGYSNQGVIIFDNSAAVTIDSSVIEQSTSPALGVLGSSTSTIKNSQFINIDDVPVMMAMFSNPTFTNISLSNVSKIGLGIISETYSQNATIPIRNFAGYNNITYLTEGSYTVNSGTTINVPAGIVFKGGSWTINGRLNTLGTVNLPVVFTTVADDTYGNPLDTRQDGNTQDPKNYLISRAISFNDISNDSSSIKNTIFRYYSKALDVNSASPKIDSCTFFYCNYGLYLTGVSQPSLTNNKFDDFYIYPNNGGYAIATSILSYPAITTNNSVSGRTCRGIFIINETLSQDVTLSKRNFAGINNIPYVFEGFTIGSGATLTIAPGVVCKFTSGYLDVNKGLIAEGGSTPDSTIVFTSIKDDFYGGDTNLDSNYTVASQNNWSGITIENQALNSLCRFRNVIIRYANYGIETTNKSPLITYSLFNFNTHGVYATGSSNPIINYCDFLNNYSYGVNNVNKTFTINAQNCWWGDNSGPTHSSNTNGIGDDITNSVSYTPFRTIDAQNPIMGDVSLNGKVQAYDAALILQKAVSIITFNNTQNKVGDVSGTAGVTAFDASLVLQYVVDKIRTFPAEELYKKAPSFLAFANLIIENSTAIEGQEVTIPFSLRNVTGMKSFDMKLEYDTKLFDFVEIIKGNLIKEQNLTQNIDNINGIVFLSCASVDEFHTEGQLFYLKLKVKANLIDAKTNIGVSNFMANEDNMTSNVKGGEIAITNGSTGVLNVNPIKFMQAYPNPFTDAVTLPFLIQNSESEILFEVIDVSGKTIFTEKINNLNKGLNAYELNSSGFKSGLYLFVLSTPSQRIIQKVNLVR